MQIRKPQRLSLVEQVTKEMEHMIQKGFWKVGERIPPEKELMEQFDVSRNTLREALRALAHVGLLETKQGSGTVIRSESVFGAVVTKHLEQSSIFQILEVRLAIEREAAYLAAKRRTEEDLVEMKRWINACQEAMENQEVQQFLEADIALHQTIVEASQNNVLIDLYASLTDSLIYSIEHIVLQHGVGSDEHIIHRDLYQTIQQKDSHAAEELVKTYITIWKNIIEETVEE